MLKSNLSRIVVSSALIFLSTQAYALGDQWYLGIGGGVSRLLPNPETSSIDRTSEDGTVATLILGRDFDTRSSGQIQLYSLGEIDFDNADTATYAAAEAALLYRFYDSRDGQRGNPTFGTSLYGRFGLGYIDRDSDLSLNNDTSVYFGAGAGIETYFTNNIGVRFEGEYFDTDAVSATVSLIARFGGLRRSTQRPPPIANRPVAPSLNSGPDSSLPETTALPETANLPETATLPETARLPETATLPETARLPETATLPETARLPETATLPETARLPEVATLPETARLPEVATLPETARLPEVATLPETARLPEVATLPETARLPETATLPETARLPAVALLPETASLPETSRPPENALPEVEVMVNATERADGLVSDNSSVQAIAESQTGIAPVVNDFDLDNIPDELDSCPRSAAGFPVGSDGCGLLGGDIIGLRFESDAVTLVSGTTSGLDYMARLLVQNPDSANRTGLAHG